MTQPVILDPTPRQLLDLVVSNSDVGDVRLRDYLYQVVELLWTNPEIFIPKRPFGHPDWQWRVYAVMAKACYVEGVFDEYDDLERVDAARADALILAALGALMIGIHAPDEPLDVVVDDVPEPADNYLDQTDWQNER